MKNNICAGIDYSMSSPGIALHKGDEWSFENCLFFYLTDSKKYLIEDDKFLGTMYPEYEGEMNRFSKLSEWVLEIFDYCKPSPIFLEGYSMGSKGRVFNIGENTGILKYNLWTNFYEFETVAPTEVKKFATGKGNANKEKMNEAFVEETGFDIRKHFDMPPKKESPTADIIDAYYICKFGFFKEKETT